MSVRKRILPSGTVKWQASVGSGKDRRREQFDTKAEALRWENERHAEMNAGTWRPNAGRTRLESLISPFLKKLDERLEDGQEMSRFHRHTLEALTKNYVLGGNPFKRRDGQVVNFQHGIGKLRLNEITPDRVSTFLHDVRRSGLSIKTTNEVHNALFMFLQFAIDQKCIATNPAARRALKQKVKKKCVVPPKLLVKRLIDAASEPIRTAIMFAALTGARCGEQRALKWRDIDFTKAKLNIDKTLNRWSEDEGRGAKTVAGNRSVPLSGDLLAALRELREWSAFGENDDLIFPNQSTGKPVNMSYFYQRLQPLFDRVAAEWPRLEDRPMRLRWHDLRHFAASTWIEAKLDPLTIQTYIGHSDFSTTMKIYGHLFETVKHHDVMDRLAQELRAQSMMPT